MIVEQLIEKVCANPGASRIVLDPQRLADLKKELLRTFRWPADTAPGFYLFMGLPIVLNMPSEFCRSCGAPIAPDVCSYCRQPSAVITVE